LGGGNKKKKAKKKKKNTKKEKKDCPKKGVLGRADQGVDFIRRTADRGEKSGGGSDGMVERVKSGKKNKPGGYKVGGVSDTPENGCQTDVVHTAKNVGGQEEKRKKTEPVKERGKKKKGPAWRGENTKNGQHWSRGINETAQKKKTNNTSRKKRRKKKG